MKLFSSFSKCFCLGFFMMVLLQQSGSLNSDSPGCSQVGDDPVCLGSLVAMPVPSPESSCNGLGSCKLRVLVPEELATPEEVQHVPAGDQQMEFKQILKHTGDHNKQTSSRSRTLMDRLSLVETRMASLASSLRKLQEESRLHLNRLEEHVKALMALLLGVLSGCKLPCSDSVLMTSILESRHLKTLDTKEDPLVESQDLGKEHKTEKMPTLLVEPSEKSERVYPRDCAEIHKQGIQDNGIYTIQPIPLRQPFEAYCDMVTDGGGWTVIQRRQDGTVDFNRTWQEYKQGFGSLQSEHWLGNEYLHSLTRLGQHALRVELEDWHGVKRHAIYRKFKVASEAHQYRLTSREYQGSAGNALSYSRNYNHDHKCFTTWDSDNDNYPLGNCGAYYGAGWWFDSCLAANLNGKYHHGRYSGVTNGIYWGTWYILIDKRTNQKYSFKKVEMKTRPLHF